MPSQWVQLNKHLAHVRVYEQCGEIDGKKRRKKKLSKIFRVILFDLGKIITRGRLPNLHFLFSTAHIVLLICSQPLGRLMVIAKATQSLQLRVAVCYLLGHTVVEPEPSGPSVVIHGCTPLAAPDKTAGGHSPRSLFGAEMSLSGFGKPMYDFCDVFRLRRDPSFSRRGLWVFGITSSLSPPGNDGQ